MTQTRTPDVVTGDVPGLPVRGMPVFNRHGQRAVIVEAEPPDPARLPELTSIRIDWSDRAAILLSLAWLADRGHLCDWMKPATHGGHVEPWDGLTAWEVSAILVARSVRRVAAGKGPIAAAYGPFIPCPDIEACMGSRDDIRGPGFSRMHVWRRGCPGWMVGTFSRGPETGDAGKLAADRAALADGCALLVPGGLLLPEPA